MNPNHGSLRQAFHPFPAWPTAEEAVAAVLRTHESTPKSILSQKWPNPNGVGYVLVDDRSFRQLRVPDAITRVILERHEIVTLECQRLGGRPCSAIIHGGGYQAVADGGQGTITIRWDGVQLSRTIGGPLGRFPLADGSAAVVAKQGGCWTALPGQEQTYSEKSVQDLVRRWEALPSPRDRLLVSEFWVGHTNPLLAAAGMATFNAVTVPQAITPQGRRHP
jgi:hypothetical protein